MPLLKDRVANLEFMIEKLNEELKRIKEEKEASQVTQKSTSTLRRRAI